MFGVLVKARVRVDFRQAEGRPEPGPSGPAEERTHTGAPPDEEPAETTAPPAETEAGEGHSRQNSGNQIVSDYAKTLDRGEQPAGGRDPLH
ncbi:unnamed protein product [Gadus morhua 'NCC']